MQLDLKEILISKAPRTARFVPNFVIGRLDKLLRIKELNHILLHYSHLPPVEFIEALLKYLEIECRMEGLDKTDPQGRYIFVSNHPFGGMDGVILALEIARRFGNVKVIVNDLLMNLRPLEPIFVPINKHGRQNREYSNTYNAAFESDLPIVTFPAGICSRKIQGKITDPAWRGNFVKMAVNSRRDVVPVFVEGQLSKRFYRVAAFRKFFRIKINLEMFLLPDEMIRQRGQSVGIVAGEPISYASFAADGKKTPKRVLEIRSEVYKLSKKIIT